MDELRITDKLSYIPCSDDPLSADVGILRENGEAWLYDVGCGDRGFTGREGCHVILSHFHRDHTANIEKIPVRELFVSKETYAHVGFGTVVSGDIHCRNLHIFPLPSSHAPGCLGFEIDSTYAFVGDALYCKSKNGRYFYNVQFLQEEIRVLKSLKAPFLLVSHHPGLIRKKEEVLAELEEIYSLRTRGDSIIDISGK